MTAPRADRVGTQPRAYLLCGPSLAGKTTVAGRITGAFSATLVSSDEINAERGLPFGGEGLPESVWAETLRIQVEHFHAEASRGRSVVVDDTLCYRWLRNRWREEAAKAQAAAILLLLSPSKAEILARHTALQSAGQRPVLSKERLLEHLLAFEWPAPEEHAILVNTQSGLEAWLREESAARHNTA
jgi:predicted kinase